jgi:hypothetical protein
MHTFGLPVACVVLLAACSTVPDVRYSYYPAEWNAKATITQTLGCDASKGTILALSTATVTPSYFADTAAMPREVFAKDLKGDFADSDFKITFTADGRLKGINQSSQGQGEAIIKAVVTLVATGAALAVDTAPTPCQRIDAWGGGKPVTIIYEAEFGPKDLGKNIAVKAMPPNSLLYDLIKDDLPTLAASVSTVSDYKSGAGFREANSEMGFSGVRLKLQEMGRVVVTVTSGNDELTKSTLLVPLAKSFDLPIPRPPLFGKQGFVLELADSGAITSVSYSSLDGTASGLNALTAIAGAETSVAKAKADALKAQSDLIVQQERAILCRTKPADCK